MKIWKDVIGFENLFMVSSCGSIYSKRSNRELKLHKHKSGYLTCATKIGGRHGKNVCFKVHQLVAKSFVYGLFEGAVVNHIDGNKENNDYKNLEWCSQQQNIDHAVKLGLIKPIPSSRRKLTKHDVKVIKTRYVPNCKKNGARALGREFNISHQALLKVLNNQNYVL